MPTPVNGERRDGMGLFLLVSFSLPVPSLYDLRKHTRTPATLMLYSFSCCLTDAMPVADIQE